MLGIASSFAAQALLVAPTIFRQTADDHIGTLRGSLDVETNLK